MGMQGRRHDLAFDMIQPFGHTQLPLRKGESVSQEYFYDASILTLNGGSKLLPPGLPACERNTLKHRLAQATVNVVFLLGFTVRHEYNLLRLKACSTIPPIAWMLCVGVP